MTGKYLVDTNVLVYAYDRSEPKKQAKALEFLDTLAMDGNGILSPQILAEFFTVVTKKISAPLSIDQGYASLGNYIQFWDVVDLTSAVVLEAARGVKDHQLSFWDSLIWATARMNQIPAILSQDFSHNSVVEGVRFINPFEGI
ncbi:MAG: PIN domain-containing protein [Nitrospirota bacterium]